MRSHAAIALVIVCLPFTAAAEVASDVHVGTDGTVSAKSLTVMQKAGTTLYTRGTWGTTYLRIGVLTGANTAFANSHGQSSTIASIKEGDIIDVAGSLVVSDTMMMNATNVRNVSEQTGTQTLTGTIASIDVAHTSFVLTNATFGSTTVQVASANMKKGSRTVLIGDLAKGDKVVSAGGSYDYAANTLTASSVLIFLPKETFSSKNFQGSVRAIDAATTPATLTLTVSGVDYTVTIPPSASIFSSARVKTTLNHVAVGDTVRVYGSIGSQHPTSISAEVVRDMNF